MARFLQINLGRGREAQDLLMQVAAEKKADVLIISEQYKKPDTGLWFQDTSGKAAIVVLNSAMRIREVSEHTADFVWAHLEGVRVYSCYFSPNLDYETYLRQLDRLEESLRTVTVEVLVAGDFNSNSPEWGSRRLDNRGEALSELIARLDLVVLNEGNSYTFRRGQTRSVVDVTLSSDGVAARTVGWRVLEDATLVDHQYLEFCMEKGPRGHMENPNREPVNGGGWVLRRLDKLRFKETLETLKRRGDLQTLAEIGDPEPIVSYAVNSIIAACDVAMPRRKKHPQTRKSVYWWNPEISELRRKCMEARRAAQRRRRRDDGGRVYEVLQSHFKAVRKQLKIAIRGSKRQSWVELCRSIDEDPRGLPYRLVTKKLVRRQPIPGLSCPERMRGIVRTLFPVQICRPADPRQNEELRIEPLTIEELQEAKARLKCGKAPGPDNIPNEVVREVIETWPELLLEAYNVCLLGGVFHERWKKQKLVLLRKGDKPLDEPSSYRPICLLDTMGKLFRCHSPDNRNSGVSKK